MVLEFIIWLVIYRSALLQIISITYFSILFIVDFVKHGKSRVLKIPRGREVKIDILDDNNKE